MRTLQVLALSLLLAGCGKTPVPPAPPPAPLPPTPVAGANKTPGPVNLTNPVDGATEPADPYEWGWLGVNFADLTPESRSMPGLAEGGAVVKGIADDSPAKDLLRVGDIVVKADDQGIGAILAFLTRVRGMKPGTQIHFSVVRDGNPAQAVVKVGSRKAKQLLATSLSSAVAWLKQQQRPDGAWEYPHPSRIGGVSTGTPHSAVTALVVAALAGVPDGVKSETAAAVEKGLAFLKGRITADGIVDSPAGEGIGYRSYTTALTAIALARHKGPGDKEALDKLIAGLRKAQMAEGRDLAPLDWTYGSWNTYDGEIETTTRSDISCASFVLQAFYEAGVPADDPTVQKALKFVKRCQNLPATGPPLPDVDDGGLTFNPRMGKAGFMQLDIQTSRNYSYGSTTADGLRCLMYCTRQKDDPRVNAAFGWLSQNYTVDKNPGFSRNGKDPIVRFDKGIFFYYLHSLAAALDLVAPGETILAQGNSRYWAVDIIGKVSSMQQKDGRWQNLVNVMNEDDPNVATALCLMTLDVLARHIK